MRKTKRILAILMALAIVSTTANAADTKISAMSSAGNAQAGDAWHIARSGADYKLTTSGLSSYLLGESTGVAGLNCSTSNLVFASASTVLACASVGNGLSMSGGTLSAAIGGSSGNIQYNSGGTAFAGAATMDSSGNISNIGTLASGSHTITSSSSTALLVGPNGATNPVLAVNDSIASQADGISITGGAAGNGTTIQALSSGSTSQVIISSKGGTSVKLETAGTDRLIVNPSSIAWSPGTSSTAALNRFGYTGAADTSLTASTEAPEVVWSLNQTRQHATGALALQRDFRIQPTTHSFAGSSTLTDAATLAVDSGPIAGTNATITNSAAIYVSGGALSGTVTNGYGLLVANPTGATNNYPAKIGSVVFDSTGVMTGAAVVPSVSTKTGTYTFVLSDNGQYVKYSSSGSATWTIPPHSSVAYPIGAQLGWGAWGGGVLTVQGGSGVQLTSSSMKYASQGGFAIQVTQDNWDIYGGTQ